MYYGTGQNFTYPVSPLQDSLVALNYKTGALVWYHQYTQDDVNNPNESPFSNFVKDWDVAGGPTLVDSECHKWVITGSKQGYFYVHDRKNGKLIRQQELVAPTPSGSGLGGFQVLPATDNKYVYNLGNYSPNGLINGDPVNGASWYNSLSSIVYKLRLSDGKLIWRITLKGTSLAPLTLVNDILFVNQFGSWDNPTRLYNPDDLTNPNPSVNKGNPVSGMLLGIDVKSGKTVFTYHNNIAPNTVPDESFLTNILYSPATIYKNGIYFAYGNVLTPTISGVKGFRLSC
jgi:hypothetical protein